jgi:hypothetical protein
MSEIITCPSGLNCRIRGTKVREERVLADRRLAKSGGQVDELLAACWEETLDASPYDFGEKAIDWGVVLQSDRFYALLQIRALTCGPTYAFKVAKLLKLIPQLSLPLTIIGLIDLVIDTLLQARSLLLYLQQQMQQILGTIDRATDLEDAGLMAIAQCAQANVAQEAANVWPACRSGMLCGAGCPRPSW